MRMTTTRIPALGSDHGQLMELLEDLSVRINGLKQWEAEHEQQVHSLSEELKKTTLAQDDLRQQRDLLSRRLSRIAKLRSLWSERHETLTLDQMQLAQDQQRLAAAQQRLEAQQLEFVEQQEELENRKRELQTQIDEQHAQTQELTQELQLRRVQLDLERADLEKRAEELTRGNGTMQAQRDQLELEVIRISDAQESLEKEQRELEQQQQQFDELKHQLQNNLTQQQQDSLAFAQEIEQRRATLDEEIALHKKQAQQLALDAQAIEAQRDQLETQAKRITLTQQRLEEQQLNLAQQQAKLDELKAELQTQLSTQQKQSEALTQDLEKRRQELELEREELQQQAAEIARDTQTIQSQRQALRLQAEEIAQAREAFEARQAQAAAEAAEKVAQQIVEPDQSEAATIAQEDLQESETTVDSAQLDVTVEEITAETIEDPVESQITAVPSNVTLSELEQREAEVKQHESELEFKIQAHRETIRLARERLKAERNELDTKHFQLKQQVNVYNTKIGELRQAYTTFKERRRRLHRYRELLAKQVKSLREAQNKVASLHQQYMGLLQNRQQLLEVKQLLTTSEERMIQQWATHGSVGSTVGVMLVLLLMAIFSYAVGDKSTQPIWRATQTMQFQLPPEKANATPLAPEQWAQAERATLLSDAVLGEALSQLAQRGIGGFANPQALHDELEKTLLVTSSKVGLLALEYHHTDKQLTVQVLEALGRARIAFQMVQDRQAGRVDSLKVVQAATLDASPLVDQRWNVSFSIFGGLVTVALLMTAIVRWRMMRAKRVLATSTEPGIRELQDVQTWPSMPEPPVNE